MPSPDAWSGRRQESGTHPLARAAVRWRTLSRRRRLSPIPCQTQAPANPMTRRYCNCLSVLQLILQPG